MRCDRMIFKRPESVAGMIVLLTLTVVIVGYVVCYALCPPNMDDVDYRMIYRDWLFGGSSSFPGSDFLVNLKNIYWNINVRLANLAESLTCWMPRWIVAVIAGMIMLASFSALFRLSNAGCRPFVKMLIIAGYILFMPWHEFMFSFAYMFNYSASAMLALWFLCVFYSDKKDNGSRLMGAVMLALICGAWHEGFSAPLFVGLGVWMLLNRSLVNRLRVLMWLALLPGIILIIGSDAFAVRAERFYWEIPFGKDLMTFMLNRPLFCVYTVVLVVVSVVKPLHRKTGITRNSLHPVIVTAFVVTIVLQSRFYMALRVGWISETMSLIGIADICGRCLSERLLSGKGVLPAVFVGICGILLAVHVFVVDACALRIHRESAVIKEEYNRSADGTVFADYMREVDYPLLSLKRPNVNFLISEPGTLFRIRSDGSTYNHIKLLPLQLKYVPYDKRQRKVPGYNPVYEIDGCYYFPADSLRCDDGKSFREWWFVSFGEYGKSVHVQVVCFTGRDGKEYVSATPERIVRDLKTHGIKRIDIW